MHFNFEPITRRAVPAPGRVLRITARSGILIGILFLSLLHNSIQAAESVTLGWQRSSDPNAVGYNIYYGVISHNYTNMVSVGNVTNTIIGGLVSGTTYYFAATTYDAQNQESGFSSEISYLVTTAGTTMEIRSEASGQFMLTVAGTVGQAYDIEATQDFKTWTVIGTVTIGVSGSLDFTDVNAPNYPQRFYRTREKP